MHEIKISNLYLRYPNSLTEFNEIIENFINSKKPHLIITLNSIMTYRSKKDKLLNEAIENANLVLPDSFGIVALVYLLQKIKIPHLPGVDLIYKIFEISSKKKYRIYLLGSKNYVIKKAVNNIKNLFPNLQIVGYHNGFFTNSNAIIKDINIRKTQILLVGLGSPYQEKWLYQNLHKLKISIGVGVGGSFDIISGRLKRAPRWIRNIGLEWFFRFLQEPWRIWRIKDLPIFFINELINGPGAHGTGSEVKK